MSIKNSKPYFVKEIEDQIVEVVTSELTKENKQVEEAALRKYIQSGKSEYENSILASVANGIYLATVQRDELAYKVADPLEKDVDEIIDHAKDISDKARKDGQSPKRVPTPDQVITSIKQTRANNLSHSINMIAYYGSAAKLGVRAVAIETQEQK